ncbi:TPA: hypothetical protein KQG52_000254 [Clostridioides difficile]|nr:hypothetical protein [Clostridioides difficile]
MHFHAGKCQLMQGIFQKENTDKALKYGIYRHLPTYEKIIRNLVSFFNKEKHNFSIFKYLYNFIKDEGGVRGIIKICDFNKLMALIGN